MQHIVYCCFYQLQSCQSVNNKLTYLLTYLLTY